MGESYCFKTFLHNKQFRSYLWCFSPRGYLHFDTYILRGFPSVPRFHNIQPIVLVLPDPPLSFQPFISSSKNRWWHVTNYPVAAIPVNYPPTHTSTNRQTKWSYIHIFKVVFSWPIFTSLRRASGFVRIFMQAVCEK